MVNRANGLLSERPNANAAGNTRYYATDTQVTSYSGGQDWADNWPLDQSDVVGTINVPQASMPNPGSCIGWVNIDPNTGLQYEAFPTAWANVSVEVRPVLPGSIQMNTVIITDAQIKAMSSGSQITVIPAPGPGKWINVIQQIYVSHFEGGAYSGMGSTDWFGSGNSTGIWNSPTNTTLSDFFSCKFGTSTYFITRPAFYLVDPNNGVEESVFGLQYWLNQPLNVFISTTQSQYAGGNPNNTLRVKTIYTIEDA